MVDLDQQECKHCPFEHIKSIKALDKDKIYFIELKFGNDWPAEIKSNLANRYLDMFEEKGIKVLIGVSDGYEIKFLEGNSENG